VIQRGRALLSPPGLARRPWTMPEWQMTAVPSPGRHCHSTLPLAVIGCHSFGIYIVILLSLPCSIKMTVPPRASGARRQCVESSRPRQRLRLEQRAHGVLRGRAAALR
jgi:hypothetical protein